MWKFDGFSRGISKQQKHEAGTHWLEMEHPLGREHGIRRDRQGSFASQEERELIAVRIRLSHPNVRDI